MSNLKLKYEIENYISEIKYGSSELERDYFMKIIFLFVSKKISMPEAASLLNKTNEEFKYLLNEYSIAWGQI